jgi:intracellular sulfur oxidation DsrE/DsrF family protein
LQALAKAGVKVAVCGQSLAHQGFQATSFNTHVPVVLGALAALAKYQREGYVRLP